MRPGRGLPLQYTLTLMVRKDKENSDDGRRMSVRTSPGGSHHPKWERDYCSRLLSTISSGSKSSRGINLGLGRSKYHNFAFESWDQWRRLPMKTAEKHYSIIRYEYLHNVIIIVRKGCQICQGFLNLSWYGRLLWATDKVCVLHSASFFCLYTVCLNECPWCSICAASRVDQYFLSKPPPAVGGLIHKAGHEEPHVSSMKISLLPITFMEIIIVATTSKGCQSAQGWWSSAPAAKQGAHARRSASSVVTQCRHGGSYCW